MDPLVAALLGALGATAMIGVAGTVVLLVRRRRTARAQEQRGVASVVPLVFAPVHALVDLVNSAMPEVRSFLAPGGEIGLLFSDIQGSTQLNAKLGDKRWAATLRRHDDVARQVMRAHGGRVVKTQGDGFMAAFHDAPSAVRAGLALRPALRDNLETAALSVRVGVHVGEVVSERGDYFGTNVVKAARIAAEATGGQVLISAEAAAALRGKDSRPPQGITLIPHGRRGTRLRGLRSTHTLYEARAV